MSGEPKKSTYATGSNGEKIPGSERQNIDDLMEMRDSIEGHPEGLLLGQVIVCMIDPLADPGTTFKDVRDVRTGEGYASFLLTDHEHPASRVTLDFPYGESERHLPPTTKEPKKSHRARDLSGNLVAGGEYQGIGDLMELADSLEGHDQGSALGWVLTSIRAFFEDAGDVYKDARDLQTGDGYASFLITQHSARTARITLTFENGGANTDRPERLIRSNAARSRPAQGGTDGYGPLTSSGRPRKERYQVCSRSRRVAF